MSTKSGKLNRKQDKAKNTHNMARNRQESTKRALQNRTCENIVKRESKHGRTEEKQRKSQKIKH